MVRLAPKGFGRKVENEMDWVAWSRRITLLTNPGIYSNTWPPFEWSHQSSWFAFYGRLARGSSLSLVQKRAPEPFRLPLSCYDKKTVGNSTFSRVCIARHSKASAIISRKIRRKWRIEESHVKSASLYLAMTAMFGALAAPTFGQAPPATKSQTPVAAPQAAPSCADFRARHGFPHHQGRQLSPRRRLHQN